MGELSSNANKELAIEQALEEIEGVWKDILIEMGEFKQVYYKVRSTEDMFTQLEDNQVQFSTMKASKFYVSFEKPIKFWEKTLSTISEVMELLLQVQRAWMYLESIFMTSEDIKRQLPKEAVLFDQVNEAYKTLTEDIVKHPVAKDACSKEGRFDLLTEMDEKLETIQKSLDQYLETKRQAFPRFYFLSNDDLLEILGQQKDPSQVQKHIKKCFVGIKTLDLISPGAQGNRTYEALAMKSKDGEVVSLSRTVIVDGPVEGWLNEVEAVMFSTVAKQCSLTLQAYRGKKDKWIREWPGQMLITVGLISWTAECTRALDLIMKGNNKSALKQAKKKEIGYINQSVRYGAGQSDEDRAQEAGGAHYDGDSQSRRHGQDGEGGMLVRPTLTGSRSSEYTLIMIQGEFGEVMVRQTNQSMEYGYEYQGNNGRLVVTPLTDRCVLTLVTALALNAGRRPGRTGRYGQRLRQSKIWARILQSMSSFSTAQTQWTTSPSVACFLASSRLAAGAASMSSTASKSRCCQSLRSR